MRNISIGQFSLVAPVLLAAGDAVGAAIAAAAGKGNKKTDQPAAENPTTDDQPAKKVNRFAARFPVETTSFKMNVKEVGKPWDDGTTSQTICDVLINIEGIEGAHFVGARVVRKIKGGVAKLDCQLPSSGGAFRRPMIDANENPAAKAELNEWLGLIVKKFQTWRLASVKAAGGVQAVAGPVSGSGVLVDDAAMSELGI